MKNDALKNNVWLVTRKPKVNCFTRHHRNSVRYQQTKSPRLSTEAIKLSFKVTLSNRKNLPKSVNLDSGCTFW